MGNAWFGTRRRSKLPVVEEEEHDDEGGVRLKVRMTSGQLQELMAKVNVSKGNSSSSELGSLIFQECLNGRLHARLVVAAASEEKAYGLSPFKYAKGWDLSPIQEHSCGDD